MRKIGEQIRNKRAKRGRTIQEQYRDYYFYRLYSTYLGYLDDI
jgi:hypothetical protein